jgi:hypothetical protein
MVKLAAHRVIEIARVRLPAINGHLASVDVRGGIAAPFGLSSPCALLRPFKAESAPLAR